MDILVGLLVIGGFLALGMFLQSLGESITDGADHPVVGILGIIVMAIGVALGVLIMAGLAQTAQQVP